MMFDTDVFVLGGGPAGLSAAIAARMAGMRVILADSADMTPIDKACGEGLLPDSLAAAAELGINILPEHGFRFAGVRFCGLNHQVSGKFPCGSGIGVRRPALHSLMVERARALRVEMLWGRPVTGFSNDLISIGREQIKARWMIGADGMQSSVRRWAGLNRFSRDSRRFSYRRHYRAVPSSDYVEIHWGTDSKGAPCQFYVTPVAADQICLVLMARTPHSRIDDVLPSFPVLHERFAHANVMSADRGALAATRKVTRVVRGNVALIGDASGSIDPITGEGLRLAFRQALHLARALKAGVLESYQHAHSGLFRLPRLMSDFMLLMDRSHFLRRRTLAAFESHPHIFSNLLAMHAGKLPPIHFLSNAAELGWQVITA